MTHDPGALAALRTQIARLEGVGRDHDALRPVIPFGLAAIDDAVPGGGLALGALHELAGTGLDTEYGTAPALLAADFPGRLDGSVCWIVERSPPFSPALAAVGLRPRRLIFVQAGHDVLQTLEDCLRCWALRAVVAELSGPLGLTASRRLQLAAETSGVTALMIRRSRKFNDPTLDAPSAAVTRWRVAAMPSPPVLPEEPEVPGIGRARWHLELRRARGGQPRSWLVDAPDDQGRLALAVPQRSLFLDRVSNPSRIAA